MREWCERREYQNGQDNQNSREYQGDQECQKYQSGQGKWQDSQNSQELRDRGKLLKKFLAVFLAAAGLSVFCCAAIWGYFFHSPCRVVEDCRGRGIDVEQMKAWEEREKDGHSGILGMAGWRIEEARIVSSVSTGRRKPANVTGVYGETSLVYPAKILSGDHSLPSSEEEISQGKRKACILSEELSDALFGSTDTAGELVEADGEILTVRGVIAKEGLFLLRPVSEGTVEYAAFRMPRRYQAEEKARRLVEGG